MTLDELVLDRTSAETFTTETFTTAETFATTEFSGENSDDSGRAEDERVNFSSASSSRRNDFSPRKALGLSLFWMAFIVFLLGLIVNNYPLMFFSIPFVLCSVICLTCKRHAGLWCAWSLFLSLDVLLRLSTGVSMHYLFIALSSGGEFNLNIVFSAILFLAAAALVIITALSLFRKKMQPRCATLALLLAGWVLLILCAPLPILLHRYSPKVISLPYLGGILVYEAEIILAAILLTFTFRYLYNRKRE